MPNLQEVPEFSEGIYQLERNDPAEGGADGIMNRQALQLAGRTLFLRERLLPLEGGHGAHPSLAARLALLETGLFNAGFLALYPYGLQQLGTGVHFAADFTDPDADLPAGWSLSPQFWGAGQGKLAGFGDGALAVALPPVMPPGPGGHAQVTIQAGSIHSRAGLALVWDEATASGLVVRLNFTGAGTVDVLQYSAGEPQQLTSVPLTVSTAAPITLRAWLSQEIVRFYCNGVPHGGVQTDFPASLAGPLGLMIDHTGPDATTFDGFRILGEPFLHLFGVGAGQRLQLGALDVLLTNYEQHLALSTGAWPMNGFKLRDGQGRILAEWRGPVWPGDSYELAPG